MNEFFVMAGEIIEQEFFLSTLGRINSMKIIFILLKSLPKNRIKIKKNCYLLGVSSLQFFFISIT